MNPEERALAHPFNPFEERAKADRMLEEALTFSTSHKAAASVHLPTGLNIRHGGRRNRWTATARGILTGVTLALLLDAALVLGLLAGLEALGGAR